MVTRVDFQQTAPTIAFSTTVTSPNFTTQVGDFILVFARCPAGTGAVVSGISLSLSGAVTTFGAGPITISGPPARQSAWAGYKVATAAQTESATATFSTTVDYRSIHVVLYRPGSGGTLSIDGSPGTATTAYGVTTITTSAITTTGGGVLCAFVGGTYGDFTAATPSSGYTAIGAITGYSSLAEKFSASALTSETVTFTETVAPNQMSFAIAYNVAIKETGSTIYEFASFNRGVGRGIARGIA
jgi:hypothetical protein